MARRVEESKPRGGRVADKPDPAAAPPSNERVGEQLPLFDAHIDRRKKEWRQ